MRGGDREAGRSRGTAVERPDEAAGATADLEQRWRESGLAALALAFNVFSAQDQVCGVPLIAASDLGLCGALGLGNRPTKAERVAWEGREPGSCAALRTHIERFPQGAYRDKAADMLAARRVTQKEIWTPSTRRLSPVRQSG